ncbi:hypothetical protein QV06_08505 [Gallibacterium genomosp. 3]|uniref:Uncharacterized protein n=1 Tax=Gallibacterium genomosp. 3 TaxID=505345 RepID=A0A1A7PQB9_9PAST|nr:hypothetical protein [Gallibacterium genomosp. 3]OBX03912.1 hypothetical protein QV06_08505 [Gallibacterium genomosp. 3]
MKKWAVYSLPIFFSLHAVAEQQITLQSIVELFYKEAMFVSQPTTPRPIIGEQIDFSPPKNKALAMRYLYGDPQYSYVAEYIEDKDKIESWKGYYFAQMRMKSPLVLLVQSTLDGIHKACDNLLVDSFTISMDKDQKSQNLQPNYNNSTYFYFCNKPLPHAPYGEGGYVVFTEGKEFHFKYWVAWRPEKAYSKPGEIIFKLQDMMPKDIKICNPEKGIACKYQYRVK